MQSVRRTAKEHLEHQHFQDTTPREAKWRTLSQKKKAGKQSFTAVLGGFFANAEFLRSRLLCPYTL